MGSVPPLWQASNHVREPFFASPGQLLSPDAWLPLQAVALCSGWAICGWRAALALSWRLCLVQAAKEDAASQLRARLS
jgi:hypothetical protein